MSESTRFKDDFESKDDFSDQVLEDELQHPRTAGLNSRRKDIALLLSVIGNVMLSFAFVILLLSWKDASQSVATHSPTHNPLVPPGVDEEVIMPVTYGWEYYADAVAKMDQVDRNWDAINPDVGVVSASRADYLQWGVLPGKDDPSDPTKGIQGLRGYHSLHCIKVVRHTMVQLAAGEKNLDIRYGHAMHCLGSLLQDIICYADDSMPLRAEGTGSDGHGKYQYVRKCRNWAAMSRWAGQRTTCMHTSDNGILDLEHQDVENCTRTDGVLIPSYQPG
ncbi:hypothetical protein B0H66DRAFT_591480 [Apodospora peruviana]|uniref:Tat pathway signal sequence n=1 Tax=Apodospora peruviana TaxID=516989 RepID=A0AAE0I591_9PEZI|nr:hypothetical protein B0H66DRAFT_591480 [Apodospora peruviana]